jgi:hypothetical protein
MSEPAEPSIAYEAYEYYGNQSDLQNTIEASRRVGHVAAMVANLHLIGNTQRAELWEAEYGAWVERRDSVIREAPLGGKWLAAFGAEVRLTAFEMDVITPAQLDEARRQP